jgi:hypothetical protein
MTEIAWQFVPTIDVIADNRPWYGVDQGGYCSDDLGERTRGLNDGNHGVDEDLHRFPLCETETFNQASMLGR